MGRKMAGKRYSKGERSQIKALMEEGLANREIAERLGKTEAGIRNLRYREGLRAKTENKIKELFEQRDTLRTQVSELQRRQSELSRSVESLEKRKESVEAILNLNELSLRFKLTDLLTRLRRERPELFTLSVQEQNMVFVGSLLKAIFT